MASQKFNFDCLLCGYTWQAVRLPEHGLCPYCLSEYRLLEKYKGDLETFKADKTSIKTRNQKTKDKYK